jgi:hypothetical protein
LFCALGFVLAGRGVRAQVATTTAGSTSASAADLETAKDLFLKGVALFNAGDIEQALDHFLRSRAAYASSKNTINAAICLDKLERYDEALELYEEALTKFASQLDDSDRATIGPTMARLRQKVGSIDVSANVLGGSLVIDQRARGKLPLLTPVRVLGGPHVVRVLKDGYAPFETKVNVAIGSTVTVEAKLKPLEQAGQLRVEDPENDGSEVYIDRALVGTAPWEGTLGPGKHLVWTMKGEKGSAPALAIVVQGQTVLVRMKSAPLGPPTRVELTPSTAELTLDKVDLGPGGWSGRLPTGEHTVVASEDGYHTQTRSFDVPPSGSKPVVLEIALVIDPTHPRWPKPAGPAGQFRLEAFGGPSFGSLASSAESRCPDACIGSPRATGIEGGLRAAYRFPFGLSAEISGGVMLLQSTFSRTETSTYGDGTQTYTATYQLHDQIFVGGPFAMGGLSQRVAIGKSFGIVARAAFGVLFLSARDPISGTASTGAESVEVSIEGSSRSTRATAIFVHPELGFDLRFGRLNFGLSLAADLFLSGGVKLDHGPIAVPTGKCPTGSNPGLVSCAPNDGVTSSEQALGRALLLVPTLTVGYTF